MTEDTSNPVWRLPAGLNRALQFGMDEDTRRALEAIERAVEEVRKMPEGPVTLSPEYLDAIRRVEALLENQSGADKTWVWRSIDRARKHFASVVRK
jgi:hypothetical protein